MNPPRQASDEELTPEPSDGEGDDMEGEEEMDIGDSEMPVSQSGAACSNAQMTAAASDIDSESEDQAGESDFDDDDGDMDDDPDFGDAPKRKAVQGGPPKHMKKSGEKSAGPRLTDSAVQEFPTSRRGNSVSSDEDYAAKSHKKKFFQRSGANSRGTATPDTSFGDSDAASWRRGAARKVVTYNEASVDYGLDSEGDDDVAYYDQQAPIGELLFSSN